jgi:hypothetical protein
MYRTLCTAPYKRLRKIEMNVLFSSRQLFYIFQPRREVSVFQN